MLSFSSHRSLLIVIHYVRLVRARDDHDDLPRRHDRADAHRDGCGRNLVDGREEALVRLAGHVRQLHLVRYDGEMVAGLVEADVAVMADAE